MRIQKGVSRGPQGNKESAKDQNRVEWPGQLKSQFFGTTRPPNLSISPRPDDSHVQVEKIEDEDREQIKTGLACRFEVRALKDQAYPHLITMLAYFNGHFPYLQRLGYKQIRDLIKLHKLEARKKGKLLESSKSNQCEV